MKTLRLFFEKLARATYNLCSFFLIPFLVIAALASRLMVNRSKKTRILLAGVETSANIQQISLALAEDLNYSVTVAQFGYHPFYSANHVVHTGAPIARVKLFEFDEPNGEMNFVPELISFIRSQLGPLFLFRVFRDYDTVFFNWTRSFLPFNIDYVLLKIAEKKVIVRHCGDDVRYRPFQHAVHKDYQVYQWQSGQIDNREMWRKFFIQVWSERTAIVMSSRDHATFQTRPLYHRPYVQQALPRTGGFDRKIPLILHAPSDPEIKGTSIVRRAIEILQSEGLEFEIRILTGVSHSEVLAALSEAAIVIDQPGAVPARFAVEGMSAGCAVIGGHVPEIHCIDGLPMLRFHANPEKLADSLRPLLTNSSLAEQLGKKAREFSRLNFSPEAFREYFAQLLDGKAQSFSPMQNRTLYMKEVSQNLQEKVVLRLLAGIETPSSE